MAFWPFRSVAKAADSAAPAPAPSTGGRLVYAIGDIHGRLDLLRRLARSIANDAAGMNLRQRPLLVFLGDYVDRGADSRGVIDYIMGLRAQPGFEVRCLKGNHEQALLQFLEDPGFGPSWVGHGGGPTLMSYGVAPPLMRSDTEGWIAARDAFAAALPASHLAFYQDLELCLIVGDYLFVHAGVRPGVPLAQQSEQDLLWIRGEFLDEPVPQEKIVVHGHTPSEKPFIGRTRIGIDTGAYATGLLSSVKLTGEQHAFLQTGAG